MKESSVVNVTSIVMCFEFVKYEAGNLIIISSACLSVLMIMPNIGSKTLDYLHEFKKKKSCFSAQLIFD